MVVASGGRPLSETMLRALELLRRPGKHTCTSIGSVLTGRQSAYGWQTSAREGGRTLRALLRRGLIRAEWEQLSNSNRGFTYWILVDEKGETRDG